MNEFFMEFVMARNGKFQLFEIMTVNFFTEIALHTFYLIFLHVALVTGLPGSNIPARGRVLLVARRLVRKSG